MIPEGTAVQYTGEGQMLSRHRVGHTGIVVGSYTRFSHHFNDTVQVVKVRWEGDDKEQGVFAANVRAIDLNPAWEV